MSSTTIILCIFLFVLSILYLLRDKIRQFRTIHTLGAGWLIVLSNDIRNLHDYIVKNNIQDWGYVWLGPSLVSFAVDPEAAKFILMNTKPEKGIRKTSPPFPLSVKKSLAPGLVWANGDEWREHRLLANPAFTENAYHGYYPKIVSLVEKCFDRIETERTATKGNLDFTPWPSRLTLDILGAAIFDHDFGMLNEKTYPFYEDYKTFINRPSYIDMLPILDTIEYIPAIRRLHESKTRLTKFLLDMIKEKSETDPTLNHDLLTRLVHPADGMGKLTTEQILADTLTFFVAGHETTANTLNWAIYELSQNPSIQEKLFSEIQNALGDRIPSYDDLKIPYLDRFLSENLRLHTPLGIFPSRVAETDLTFNDKVIPKGSLLSINFYSLHRNPKYWPDPHRFDPDRFLPENKKDRHRFAFVPFSAGTRQCIGMDFSLVEQKLFIARLVQKYRVSPSQIGQTLTLRSRPFFNMIPLVNVYLEPRQYL